jgi:hypothetical protein
MMLCCYTILHPPYERANYLLLIQIPGVNYKLADFHLNKLEMLQIKVAPLHSCQNMGMNLDRSMLAVFQTLREANRNVI